MRDNQSFSDSGVDSSKRQIVIAVLTRGGVGVEPCRPVDLSRMWRRQSFHGGYLRIEQCKSAALKNSGKSVVEIHKDGAAPFEDTVAAMRCGTDVIVQGRLEHGSWAGWADVLLRVPGESVFGSWRYEPVETMLAIETRGATLLQLCLYAELLCEIQGADPELLRVAKPDTEFIAELYRFAEFRAYFRLVRRNFERSLAQPLPQALADALTYPEPVAHCDVCNWHSACRQRWVADDSVCLVAGIRLRLARRAR